MHLSRMAVAGLLILSLNPYVSGQESQGLSKGSYRLKGECLEMTWVGDDKKSCETYMGIIASDSLRPEFVFARTDGGAWMFKTSEQIENSEGVSRYRVASSLDIGMRMQWKYDGECSINRASRRILVTCTTWRDPDHKNVARRVEFSGDGTWLFSKSD